MTEVKVICANIIEKDNKFLLVKETKERVKGKYNFPAGSLEGNEDIIEGAKRKAKEETGLNVKPTQIVGIFQRPTTNKGDNNTIIVFKSRIVSGEIEASKEHPEVKYFTEQEIRKMDQEGLLRSPFIIPALGNYLNERFYDLSLLIILS